MKKKRPRGKGSKDPFSTDLREIMRRQIEAFQAKFGRRPKPDEPLFFDPSKDRPAPMEADALRKEILDAMKIAGTPPEIVYAYTKTGMLLNASFTNNYPADNVAEWNAAIDEYYAMAAKREHSDISPNVTNEDGEVPPSKIPALKELSFSETDNQLVLDCLEAIDSTISRPTSLRLKLELAAAILAWACAAAYESAAAHGKPDDAEDRYEAFEELAAARARELFNASES